MPGSTYLTDEQWADTGMCSDVEVEKVFCAANARAHEEQQKLKYKESRLMWSIDGISRPIPRSERGIQLKIAKSIYAAHRQKRNFDGLYKVLAPGSTLGKMSPTTTVIKEPNRPEVRVRISDIAKFGTRNERRRTRSTSRQATEKKKQENTLEQKIINHKNALLRKDLGSKKIMRAHKQPDDIIIVSLGRSCFTYNVNRALKIRIPKRNPEAFQNTMRHSRTGQT